MYHLIRYCENSANTYYQKLYNLLIVNGSDILSDDDLFEIKMLNSEEEILPENLKNHVSNITAKYKNTENLIVKIFENTSYDKLSRCIECQSLINYTKDIHKIISYAKSDHNIKLFTLIWFAYNQRKLLNKIFDKYYKINNVDSYFNNIHRRHCHVLKVYANNLIEITA